jgi:hypothetical protein
MQKELNPKKLNPKKCAQICGAHFWLAPDLLQSLLSNRD